MRAASTANAHQQRRACPTDDAQRATWCLCFCLYIFLVDTHLQITLPSQCRVSPLAVLRTALEAKICYCSQFTPFCHPACLLKLCPTGVVQRSKLATKRAVCNLVTRKTCRTAHTARLRCACRGITTRPNHSVMPIVQPRTGPVEAETGLHFHNTRPWSSEPSLRFPKSSPPVFQTLTPLSFGFRHDGPSGKCNFTKFYSKYSFSTKTFL